METGNHTPMNPAVVILNMHYSGLAIARDLSKRGIPVFGLGAHGNFPGNYSKHCRFLMAPDSRDQPEKLLAFLQEFAKGFAIKPLLFPTRDHDIHFINANRTIIESGFRLAFPSREIMDESMNKDKLYVVAKRCGVKCPRTFSLNGLDDLNRLRDELPFPCIVKPVYSSQWRKPGIWDAVGRQKVAILDSYASLDVFYRGFVSLDPLVNIQEVIPGPETNLAIFGSYANMNSEVVNYFTARKVLQYPALFGTGIIVESFPQPSIIDQSMALIRALRLTGISEIEYKINSVTGECFLIEINPRHWDQHGLGTACGVNLTLTAYLDILGRGAPRFTQNTTRIKWIAEADLAYQLAKLFGNGLTSVRKLLSDLGGSRIYSVWNWRDIKPGTVQALNLLKEAIGLSISMLRRKANRTRVKS